MQAIINGFKHMAKGVLPEYGGYKVFFNNIYTNEIKNINGKDKNLFFLISPNVFIFEIC